MISVESLFWTASSLMPWPRSNHFTAVSPAPGIGSGTEQETNKYVLNELMNLPGAMQQAVGYMYRKLTERSGTEL